MSLPNTIPQTRSTPEGTVFDPDATAPLDVDVLAIEEQQRALLVRVFSIMVLGLMTSAAVGYLALKNTDIYENAIRHSVGFQIMFLLEMVTVAFISNYVEKLTIPLAWVTFIFYSAFNGISFAIFFLWLPPESVAFGFFVTALTFGAMALYGRYTKCDLGSVRNVGILMLTGIVLMTVLNIMLGHGESYYATSFLGIMFFAGLTASHVRDLRDLDWEFEDDDATNDKAALVGALLLYLDFVNLYMLFMRFAMRSRNPRISR